MNNLPVYILYYTNAELISEKGLQFARARGSDRVFFFKYIELFYENLYVPEPKKLKYRLHTLEYLAVNGSPLVQDVHTVYYTVGDVLRLLMYG